MKKSLIYDLFVKYLFCLKPYLFKTFKNSNKFSIKCSMIRPLKVTFILKTFHLIKPKRSLLWTFFLSLFNKKLLNNFLFRLKRPWNSLRDSWRPSDVRSKLGRNVIIITSQMIIFCVFGCWKTEKFFF